MTTIGINDHYRRAHRPGGGGAEFVLGHIELLERVHAALGADSFTEDTTEAGSQRRCVRLLDVSGFRCGLVRLLGGERLRARPARDGEPFMQPCVERRPPRNKAFEKAYAVVVDVYLYSAAALAEGDEATTDCDWEVVGMSARTRTGDEPPHPVSMMRNQLGHDGGTRKTYTPGEWASAVEYWSQHAMLDAEDRS